MRECLAGKYAIDIEPSIDHCRKSEGLASCFVKVSPSFHRDRQERAQSSLLLQARFLFTLHRRSCFPSLLSLSVASTKRVRASIMASTSRLSTLRSFQFSPTSKATALTSVIQPARRSLQPSVRMDQPLRCNNQRPHFCRAALTDAAVVTTCSYVFSVTFTSY